MSPLLLPSLFLLLGVAIAECPAFEDWASQSHPPLSEGQYAFPLQRPAEECRTYKVPTVEKVMYDEMSSAIGDPDLYRLFLNTWPNTLDTTVKWTGVSEENPEEELAFIITGDINAMWLRDSANQLQSYKSVLTRSDSMATNSSSHGIAALYRGAINLQGRYIRNAPYCNAFQPPVESKIAPVDTGRRDRVKPAYDAAVVFECKYELDSLAAFLQLSWDYYEVTEDTDFFRRFSWAETIKTIVALARDMQSGTYAADGRVNESPYTWHRDSDSASETVANNGRGAPVNGNIGLIRSFFRPSDDSCIYQYLIPANMMFSRYLLSCARIMKSFNEALGDEMESLARDVEKGINAYAVVRNPVFGEMYAYEVDGFGSYNLMDDANLPSLLSIPHMGYEPRSEYLYANTRAFVLSDSNPYFARGPILNATGGPHLGPGMAWPMGAIMQVMTTDDDKEIVAGIKQLLGSTSRLGLIHETVKSHDDTIWTRPWFAWANGLFGQMILDLKKRKPELISRSFQDNL